MPLLVAISGFPDVTTASSGQRALDALANSDDSFDCLLLDINMPGMDGVELCERVRRLEAYRTTPIIMLTAMSEGEYIDSAFKAGTTDYATKPFDIDELGARLRVAHKLIIARREAKLAKALRAPSGSATDQMHGFGLSETIRIDGLQALVDFGSLKN
ncbi:MAG: response regulator [Cypionkella sp.]|nr:response regulator [Cypionkella sp.]